MLIKFFIPLVLGIICFGDLLNEIQKPYGGYTWNAILLIGRDWFVITLAAALVLTTKPWKSGLVTHDNTTTSITELRKS